MVELPGIDISLIKRFIAQHRYNSTRDGEPKWLDKRMIYVKNADKGVSTHVATSPDTALPGPHKAAIDFSASW
jgi:hypothetical protein